MTTKNYNEENKSDSILKYSEWIYRGVMIFGFVAVLYANQKYVTRDEFKSELEKVTAKIEIVSEKISLIDKKIEVDKVKMSSIEDHEQRIRALEKQFRDLQAYHLKPATP